MNPGHLLTAWFPLPGVKIHTLVTIPALAQRAGCRPKSDISDFGHLG